MIYAAGRRNAKSTACRLPVRRWEKHTVTEKPAFDCARDWHLFGLGPKRILALDGGGVRGAISVAFLERIESIISERLGIEARLGDWFDLVGGTSTGALIAGALALGFRTEQVKEFYLRLAPRAFQPTRWGIPLFQAKFNADGLRAEILKIVKSPTFQRRSHHRSLRGHQAHGHLQSLDRRQQSARPLLAGRRHP
jgi:hypothetical protein